MSDYPEKPPRNMKKNKAPSPPWIALQAERVLVQDFVRQNQICIDSRNMLARENALSLMSREEDDEPELSLDASYTLLNETENEPDDLEENEVDSDPNRFMVTREHAISLMRKEKVLAPKITFNATSNKSHRLRMDSDDGKFLLFFENYEKDEPHAEDPRPVWFKCTNIPNIGYIYATKSSDQSIVLQIPPVKTMVCYNEKVATETINCVLKDVVGFQTDDITSEWKMTTFRDVKSLSQIDFSKLNKKYVITLNGFEDRPR